MRCMHEASLWEYNCFITLTYDDEHLPPSGSLVPEDYVLFMKRLRKRYGNGIRFFHCGEYGAKLQRPHHHAILFNLDFGDTQRVCSGVGGTSRLYQSAELSELWGKGFCTIGAATFQSAGYIARYSLKKVVDKNSAEFYKGRVREYLTMSRRPGIGAGWIRRWASEVLKRDEVFVNGTFSKPTRYYDDYMARVAKARMVRIKMDRRDAGRDSVDNTGRRLVEREEVKKAMITQLTRSYEDGRA